MSGPTIRCRCALLAVLLAIAASPALGWNAGTHRLVATIAWRSLSAQDQALVYALLRQHPDYPRFHSPRATEMEQAHAAGDRVAVFAEASVWADQIRDSAGFPDTDAHRDWHYVNQPLGEAADSVIGGKLDQALPRLTAMLADRRSPDRADALVWLLHLVADLHQPLHVATRRLSGQAHDAGGNATRVGPPPDRTPRRLRGATLSLHAYWDELVAPPWLAGRRLSDRASELMRSHRRTAEPVDLRRWRRESYDLARQAYRPAIVGRQRIDAHEHDRDRALAERQVALAGFRLASLLAAALGPPVGGQAPGTGAKRAPGARE